MLDATDILLVNEQAIDLVFAMATTSLTPHLHPENLGQGSAARPGERALLLGDSMKTIEFDNIVGGQDRSPEELTAKGDPFHLKVTRHDYGQHTLTLSCKDPAGKKHALIHFWLTHAAVQAIADLSEAPQATE